MVGHARALGIGGCAALLTLVSGCTYRTQQATLYERRAYDDALGSLAICLDVVKGNLEEARRALSSPTPAAASGPVDLAYAGVQDCIGRLPPR
jgi:hypothetical protein